MSDYRATIANCPLRGIEFTQHTANGHPARTRNLIRLKAGGFDLELTQDLQASANVAKLIGNAVDTTDLLVRNVAPSQVARLQEVILHVSELLSFATESRVLPHSFQYPAGSAEGGSRTMVGTIQHFRPPFGEPEQAKHLVDTCFDRYEQLRTSHHFHIVVDYIHHSVMSGLAVEVKIALACITFENLRHNWALVEGYPHIRGFFREKGATLVNPGDPVGIKRHLEEMFAAAGMTSDADRIIKIRNQVLHTGLINQPDNFASFAFLETVLREYFLRRVGYHGKFLPYEGGTVAPITI